MVKTCVREAARGCVLVRVHARMRARMHLDVGRRISTRDINLARNVCGSECL